MVGGIYYSGICMAALFGTYMAIYGLITKEYATLGFYSHFIIYSGNFLGSILAPFCAYYLLGVKGTILLGGITYLAWGGVFLAHRVELLLLLSLINGIGNGFLRTQQYVWVNSLPETGTLEVGIFSAIFSLYGLFGALLSYAILIGGYDVPTLMISLTAVSIIAYVGMLGMQAVPRDASHMISLRTYGHWIIDKRIVGLYPLIILQALTMILNYSVLPLLYTDSTTIMAYYLLLATIKFLASYALAYIFARTSTLLLLVALVVASGSQVLAVYWEQTGLLLPIITGLLDAGVEGVMVLILSRDFNKEKTIFSYHRLIYCLGCMSWALLAPHFAIMTLLICYLVMTGITVLGYLWYQRRPVEEEELMLLV